MPDPEQSPEAAPASGAVNALHDDPSTPPWKQSRPASPAKEDIVVGCTYEGLKLVDIRDATKDYDQDEEPNIDAIHVMVVRPEEERLGLDTLFPWSVCPERRYLVFHCEMASLLVGDLIGQSVESHARRLLQALVFFRRHHGKRPGRAIVFIAYDFGALVVKRAISIAAASNRIEWTDIFTSATRFVFSGCFQRTESTQGLYLKVLDYLRLHRGSTWDKFLTPTSISSLVDLLIETTEEFLLSKITLLSRVISLYANADSPVARSIHDIFDRYTATVGAPYEVIIQEGGEDDVVSFQGLDDALNFKVQDRDSSPHSFLHPSWVPVAQTLVALSTAHSQFTSPSFTSSHPIFRSPEHKTWMASGGPRVLYIDGGDYGKRVEAAEQEFLFWRLEREGKYLSLSQRQNLPFFFRFSSHDPARNSIKAMFSTLFLHLFAGYAMGTRNDDFDLILDQFQLQHSWTEADLAKLLLMFNYMFVVKNRLLVLQDMDECDERGRALFWGLFSRLATITEERIKIVVTSRSSPGLLEELKRWPDLPVHTYNLPGVTEIPGAEPSVEYLDGLVSGLCPGHYGESRIRKSLEGLTAMEGKSLDALLKLLTDATAWPRETSAESLHQFCSRLQDVNASSTPSEILDRVLRNTGDQDGLRWVFDWLLHGYRPLTWDELAMAFYYRDREDGCPFDIPSPARLHGLISQLRLWLRPIVKSNSCLVLIRTDVRGLLLDDPDYIWAETTSSCTVLLFLLRYLTAPEVQRRLDSIFTTYQTKVQSSYDGITPPLIPDGHDLIFYAVQSLPHLLAGNPRILHDIKKTLRSPRGLLTKWSKVFWAMSNPFSRPDPVFIGPHWSACDIILALEGQGPNATAFAALGDLKSVLRPTAVQGLGLDPSAKYGKMEALAGAIWAADEDTALHLAAELISASKSKPGPEEDVNSSGNTPTITWPSSFLWKATWLNMDLLVSMLLHNGMNPDPTDTVSLFFPSPLYMAARLSHHRVLRALLKHGARIDVKRQDTYNSLYTATGSGSTLSIKSLVAKDKGQLELQQPETPLYIASYNGNWKAARTLLELGADPDSGIRPGENYRWAPLVAAVDGGHAQSVKTLLEWKADPNIRGPGNQDTPLWFAAVREENLECVRLLLEHNADPNHELLNPPLLVEVAASASAESRLEIIDALVNNTPPARIDDTSPAGLTPLLYAAKRGDLPIAKRLLEHKADINAIDSQGRCALYYAILGGRNEFLQELLRHKPRLDFVTEAGDTLLAAAVEDLSVVETLLDAGADPEQLNGAGSTLINIAVSKQQVNVVKLLIDRGANIHHRDRYDWSPIMDAAGYVPNAEMMRILIEAGANLRDSHVSGRTILQLASGHDLEVLRVILEYRKEIDLEGRDTGGATALIITLDAACIRLLVRAGADVNAQSTSGWTALMRCAAGQSNAEAFDFLLSQPEIDINMVGKTCGSALTLACHTLNIGFVRKLLDAGAGLNTSLRFFSGTALKAACLPQKGTRTDNENKIEELVRELVARGADVNDMYGYCIYNALCAACLGANVGTINFLLDNGASAQHQDPLGRLPIHFGAANGIENFEAAALAHAGDIMVNDRAGKNVLHWAAQFGHKETLEFILERRISSARDRKRYIDQPDIDGWTPLCWATRPFQGGRSDNMQSELRDYVETVSYLIEMGADPSVEFYMGTGDNRETFTPAVMASLCGVDDKMISLLTKGAPDDILREYPWKKYKTSSALCDICLNVIFGLSYQCQTCLDFDACKKCYGRINLYHSHISDDDDDDDNKPHEFKLREGADQEFEEPPTPSPRGSPRGDEEGSQVSEIPQELTEEGAGAEEGLVPVDRGRPLSNRFDALATMDLDDLDVSEDEDRSSS